MGKGVSTKLMKRSRRSTEQIIQILRDLEKENSELKKMLADQMLKNRALEIVLEKNI